MFRIPTQLFLNGTALVNLSYPILSYPTVLELVRGPWAAQAGIVYLQDEKFEFRTKENGKLWSVYGSPVSSSVFSHVIQP